MKLPFGKIINSAKSAGFTMIELLVVIAVLGVLAVAVLSSLNPIEQINKGRDTRTRSDAAQFINATDRFFAIAEMYPWNDATYGGGASSADTPFNLAFPGAAHPGCTATLGFCALNTAQLQVGAWGNALADTEEVKQSFLDRIMDAGDTANEDGDLYVYKEADEDLFICFYPSSRQFQNEALESCIDRAGNAGYPPNACPQATYTATTLYGAGATDEMICLP